MSNDKKDVPDISGIVEKLLKDISELQVLEGNLLNNLQVKPNLTSAEQTALNQQITKLSTMRSNLYTTLSEINAFYQTALSSSTGTLSEQTTAINIVESELTRSKKRLEYLEMQRNNKVRLVEINEYYGDKYYEHTNLMKIVIFTLIPIIILTILYNKGLLPSRIYYILFIIVGIVGAVYFWKTYASIITRDNMMYDSYNWPFDAKSAPKGSGDGTDPWLTGTGLGLGTCVGENCCSVGQTYNTKIFQCVGTSSYKENFQSMQPATYITTETDIQNALTKTQPGKYKADVNLSDTLKPYNG